MIERSTAPVEQPAFPAPIAVGPAGDIHFPTEWGLGGMSLRDYFAAQALPGVIALNHGAGKPTIASIAYGYADAMMAERAKPKPDEAPEIPYPGYDPEIGF